MSSTETKIELVTEAIEALSLATVVVTTCAEKDRKASHQNVLDARGALHDALLMLLQPTLRVVSSMPIADDYLPSMAKG